MGPLVSGFLTSEVLETMLARSDDLSREERESVNSTSEPHTELVPPGQALL